MESLQFEHEELKAKHKLIKEKLEKSRNDLKILSNKYATLSLQSKIMNSPKKTRLDNSSWIANERSMNLNFPSLQSK